MSVSSIEEAIQDIKAGKMVILVDDEDRENEGDLTLAAEAATPENINFMAKYGRGLARLVAVHRRPPRRLSAAAAMAFRIMMTIRRAMPVAKRAWRWRPIA